jgi:hypothetical protein
VKRGVPDSDARCASEQDGPQVKPGTGQSRRAARGPGGKRWCQTGMEGGTGSRIRA